MNVEIGAEAAQFPEKEYINGNVVAVYDVEKTIRQNNSRVQSGSVAQRPKAKRSDFSAHTVKN
jgi:hypothetical protein